MGRKPTADWQTKPPSNPRHLWKNRDIAMRQTVLGSVFAKPRDSKNAVYAAPELAFAFNCLGDVLGKTKWCSYREIV
ncbi:hypothetical protein [Vannielia sp.]|uniref:hypothetical protein n=1 Tax=Vannielia sp. TaxID=2813045 RepID=UPI00262F61B9|nr:hypothetical protein [Vannielia sp.]MDF1873805.1 hypothetical protein [Vannielia sp.]